MAVRVCCFYQQGCMSCREQTPVNRQVEKTLSISIEEIDVVKNPQYIRQYGLKVTPTIVILNNDVVQERFDGVVRAEQLEASLKKYG